MNDTTKAKLVAAPHRRAQAHLGVDRQRDRRPRLEAQARCRDGRGTGGTADPRRSRRRHRRAHRGRDRRRTLRQAGQRRRSEGDPGGRSREGARPRSRSRWRSMRRQAVRHPGRRRQRLGQDHHHRQARGAFRAEGRNGDAGGRRHVPRRRDRAAEDLGRAHRRDRDRARAGLGCREPRLRGAHRGEGATAPTC